MSERIAGYEIRWLLERWGEESFYVAYQASMHRLVILRVLDTERWAGRAEKFLEEARKLAAIDHPNVARLHEAGQEGRFVFCSIEYPGDATLERLLSERGRLPLGEVAEVARQVLEALGCAHSQGMIHGALRPRMVFVVAGRVRVGGFGASPPRDLMLLGDAVQYLSPEHASAGALDPRSDIYSLGMILYRALSGRLPYRDLDPRVVIRRQVEEKPLALQEIVTDLPAAVSLVVARAIEKDPRLRFQSAEDMNRVLAAASPPAAAPAKPSTRPRTRPPRQHRKR